MLIIGWQAPLPVYSKWSTQMKGRIMEMRTTYRIDLTADEVRAAVMAYLRSIRDEVPDNDGLPAIEDICALTVVWTEFEPKKQ